MSKAFVPGLASVTEAAHNRRLMDGWFVKYLKGKGLDIGCGKSVICANATPWDIANGDGDAELLTGIPDASQDFIYASHVLEHLKHPRLALQNWWSRLRGGGFLLLSVPEEDSYEKGFWPSLGNPDHKTTWSANKAASWSTVSINMLELLSQLPKHKLHSLTLQNDGHEWASVEAIIQKQDKQYRRVDSIVANVVCMCGAKDVLFRGTTISGGMLFECLDCGQCLKLDLQEHVNMVNSNIDIITAAYESK